MYLVHKATIKHPSGVIDINVLIVDDKIKMIHPVREYTFSISSEKAARSFHALYRKGKSCHGRALTLLNKFKMKEEK